MFYSSTFEWIFKILYSRFHCTENSTIITFSLVIQLIIISLRKYWLSIYWVVFINRLVSKIKGWRTMIGWKWFVVIFTWKIILVSICFSKRFGINLKCPCKWKTLGLYFPIETTYLFLDNIIQMQTSSKYNFYEVRKESFQFLD